MLATLLSKDMGDNEAFALSEDKSWTRAQFLQGAELFAANLRQQGASRVILQIPDSVETMQWLVAANLANASICILDIGLDTDALGEAFIKLKPDLHITTQPIETTDYQCNSLNVKDLKAVPVTSAMTDGSYHDSELWLYTSGTTGRPKCVRYKWSDLLYQVKGKPSTERVIWLMAYHLHHFAAIQLFAHVLVTHAHLVITSSRSVSDQISLASRHNVTHITASPTFWRMALANSVNERILPKLEQITLGSEAVTQSLLDRLHESFPKARLTQAYASTEAGYCFSVSGGKSGFPAHIFQDKDSLPVRVRIQDGELYIRSSYGMSGYLSERAENSTDKGESDTGWRASGDMVETIGDRIYIIGRRSEIVNVGGTKVHPQQVEDCVSQLPSVMLAKAYGKSSMVTGQVVVLDIVLTDGYDCEVVAREIDRACFALARAARPCLVNFVEHIDIQNTKLVRKSHIGNGS